MASFCYFCFHFTLSLALALFLPPSLCRSTQKRETRQGNQFGLFIFVLFHFACAFAQHSRSLSLSHSFVAITIIVCCFYGVSPFSFPNYMQPTATIATTTATATVTTLQAAFLFFSFCFALVIALILLTQKEKKMYVELFVHDDMLFFSFLLLVFLLRSKLRFYTLLFYSMSIFGIVVVPYPRIHVLRLVLCI